MHNLPQPEAPSGFDHFAIDELVSLVLGKSREHLEAELALLPVGSTVRVGERVGTLTRGVAHGNFAEFFVAFPAELEPQSFRASALTLVKTEAA